MKAFSLVLILFLTACATQPTSTNHLPTVEVHSPCEEVGAFAVDKHGNMVQCLDDEEETE